MTGMKITLDAAMRARDVSRPTAAQEAAAGLSEPDLPQRRDQTDPSSQPTSPPPRTARQPGRSEARKRRSDTSGEPARGRQSRRVGTGHRAEATTQPADGLTTSPPPQATAPEQATPAALTRQPDGTQRASGPRLRRRARLGRLARRQDQPTDQRSASKQANPTDEGATYG